MSKRLATDPCRVEGCDRPLYKVTTKHGGKVYTSYDYLCRAHRSRWTKRKSFELVERKGLLLKSDDRLRGNYRKVQINGQSRHRARRIWEEAHGCTVPKGYHVHHLDGNRLNDTPENLQAMPAREHHRLHGGRYG